VGGGESVRHTRCARKIYINVAEEGEKLQQHTL
jgi:hypothetical protein